MDMQKEMEWITRRLKREKIVVPEFEQYVDQCQWSKTGWAVWDKDGSCTCKPAKAPKAALRQGEAGDGK